MTPKRTPDPTVHAGDFVILRHAVFPFCAGTAARVEKVGSAGTVTLSFPGHDTSMVLTAEGTRPLPFCTHCGQKLVIRRPKHWYERGTWVAADSTVECTALYDLHFDISEPQSHRPADTPPHRA